MTTVAEAISGLIRLHSKTVNILKTFRFNHRSRFRDTNIKVPSAGVRFFAYVMLYDTIR